MGQNVPVHNDYGRMLAETGGFSLICFIFILFFSFRNFRQVIRQATDPFIQALGISFCMFLIVMVVYWFFHEYIMEEPFVSILPFAFSVVLKNIVEKEEGRTAAGALPGESGNV